MFSDQLIATNGGCFTVFHKTFITCLSVFQQVVGVPTRRQKQC